MKKLLSLLLAGLLLAVCSSAALADVSASYSDGKVTVSTDEYGFWEITIDSEWVGYWVGHLHPSHTFSMKLEDGEHKVRIFCPDEARTVTSTFWVGDAQPSDAPDAEPTARPDANPDAEPADESGVNPEPTATPEPTGPVMLNGVSYATGVLKLQVSGLRRYAEVWMDGENTGLTVTENGEVSLIKLLDEGEHTLALYVPAYDELDSADFSAAAFTPKAEALRDVIPSLVKNEAGEILGSGLVIDRDEISYLLRVSVDSKSDAVLTIEKEQLQALLDQGLNIIEYVNGKAALRIDLTKISDEWFETEAPVTAYRFFLLAGEEGTEVTVSARTETENVPASFLAGITLIRGSERVAVKENGVY